MYLFKYISILYIFHLDTKEQSYNLAYWKYLHIFWTTDEGIAHASWLFYCLIYFTGFFDCECLKLIHYLNCLKLSAYSGCLLSSQS